MYSVCSSLACILITMNRVLYLARTYGTLKKYAEALSLTAKAHIYLREARSHLSTSGTEGPKPEEVYYPLSEDDIIHAEEELEKEENKMKMDWYTYNGGLPTTQGSNGVAGYKKPTFYDVAFNYVELPMDRLQARASGGKPPPTPPATAAARKSSIPPAPPSPVASKSMAQQTSTTATGGDNKRRAKVEDAPPPSPEVKIVQSGGLGLGSILGGWWGRK